MGESSDNTSAEEDRKPVDLSELQNLSFGPNWTEKKERSFGGRSEEPSRGRGRGAPGGRDRRPARKPAASRGDEPARERGQGHVGERRGGRRDGGRRQQSSGPTPHVEFQPVVEAHFYPEDIPFKALCHAMRGNCRTYELFEIARLILDKPERFVVVARALPGPDGTVPPLYCSVPDGVPFLTEEAAVSHVVKEHVGQFFTLEEVEVEPPKGNFLSVGRCGFTGELLGPPNYHRYQALLHEHHGARLSGMSFEKFQSRVEQVKDPEVVQEWLKKMTHVTRYHVKDHAEGEPSSFDGLEAARLFILSRRREKVVRPLEQMRFHGKVIESLPRGDLRRSLEALWDHQKRFPLETANNLRGRLRRMRFTIYKKGSKGVSYVCAVKRKFRTADTFFSDSIHSLITFIEKNPMIVVSDLPEKFLGVKPEQDLEVPVEKAPDIEEVPTREAAAIVETHELKRRERIAAQKAADEAAAPEGEPSSGGSAEPAATAEETPVAEDSAASVDKPAVVEPSSDEASAVSTPAEPAGEAEKATPAPASTDSEKTPAQHLADKDPRVRQMAMDLHWLVSEGLVVEFGDGRLQAVPVAQAGRSGEQDQDEDDGGQDDSEALAEDIPAAVKE